MIEWHRMAHNLVEERLTQPHLAFPQSPFDRGALGFHQKSVSVSDYDGSRRLEVSRSPAV